jgi:hypothetical protein
MGIYNSGVIGAITKKSGNITTSVASGSSNADFTVTPPSGELWHLIGWRIYIYKPAPGVATSGTHTIYLWSHGTSIYSYDIKVINAYDSDLIITTGRLNSSSNDPTLKADLQRALKSITCLGSVPLVCKYYNNSDAATTSIRNYSFVFERFKGVDD